MKRIQWLGGLVCLMFLISSCLPKANSSSGEDERSQSRTGGETPSRSGGASGAASGAASPSPSPSPTPVASVGDVYVAPTGDDSNAGTLVAPKRTIQNALTFASGQYGAGAMVHVLEGSYMITETIEFPAGISLYGGYRNGDWNTRNPALYPTVLTDTRSVGGLQFSPLAVLFLYGNLNDLVIDGLTVNAGSGQYSAAIKTNNAYYYTVQNCILNGGNGVTNSVGFLKYMDAIDAGLVRNNEIFGGNGGRSYGVLVAGAAGKIESNTVRAGTGNWNFGVYLDQAHALTVEGNHITGGTGNFSHGIYTTNGPPTISQNTVSGGTGSTKSFGLYSTSAIGRPVILDNTISGGTSIRSYGIYNMSSIAVISGNTINGGRSSVASYGLYNSSDSTEISGNAFDGGQSDDEAYGVYLINPNSPALDHNTINGGQGGTGAGGLNQATALFASGVVDLDLNNNVFFTTGGNNRYCVYSWGVSGNFTFSHNDLSGCPSSLLYTTAGSCTGNNDGDGWATTCNIVDINGLTGSLGNTSH